MKTVLSLVLFVLVTCLSLSESVEDTYYYDVEKSKHFNREELVVNNFTTDANFKINQIILKWSSFTLGPVAYTAGIDAENSRKLVVIFSTLGLDISTFNNTVKVFDLQENALPDIQLFYQKQKGKNQLLLVIYFPKIGKLSGYTFKNYELEKIWSFSSEHEVTHINVFQISNKNFILLGITNKMENDNGSSFRAVLYQFDRNLQNYWFFQSIDLSGSIDSSAISNFEGTFFLALTQKIKGSLEIYVFQENHFIPYFNLSSSNISQVVSFENGFKSFLAINGYNASIYEFTKYGLEKSTIINSNMEGLDFWQSIPVQTYRDETLLLAQRTLDHGTHKSFDFDIFTYNGGQFEEHEDVRCYFFGEEQNRLKCLGEFETTAGIGGATHISVENALGLLIPNTNGLSLLFMINYGIRPLFNPKKVEIDQFLIEKEKLASILKTNEEAFNKRSKAHQSFREIPENTLPRSSKSADALKSLAKMEKLSQEANLIIQEIDDLNKVFNKNNNRTKTYHNIIFNAPVEIESYLETVEISVEKINNEETSSLLKDIATSKNLEKIEGSKTFFHFKVNNIQFKTVNGISNEDFVLKRQKDLLMDGHVSFAKEAIVQSVESEFVNHIKVEEEWIDVRQNIEDSITFEDVKVENIFNSSTVNNLNLHFVNFGTPDQLLDSKTERDIKTVFFPGNVTIENINGKKLETFLSQLCLSTMKCFIPNLKVLGNVTVTGHADTEYLNELKYPDNFVLSESQYDEEILIEISGSKTFLEVVRGYDIITNSSVNNIKPELFITVNTLQNSSGEISFTDVEVKSILEVNGKIKGESVDNVLKNFGLEETETIKSNVEFMNLEVLGNIFVENQFSNLSLKEVLDDLISQNEESAIVNSTKQFLSSFTVLKNLNIESSSIGNISLKKIATKNTNEHFNIRKITGVVDIENLTTKGTFDERNITQLNKSLLKITDDANISSILIFEQPIEANSLEIEVSLNDLTSDKYLYNDLNNTNTKNIVLGDVVAEKVVIEGNVYGNIGNFNLSEIIKNTLKYTGDEFVNEKYMINKSVLHNLNVGNINNKQFFDLFPCNSLEQTLSEMTISGKIKVNNLTINGYVNLGTIENKDFISSLEEKPWAKLLNKEGEEFVIEGNVHFDSVEIEELASVNFGNFITTLVFKDEQTVVIHDSITFEKNVAVEKLLETLAINEMPIENILRNDGEQTIRGKLTIFGNATFIDSIFIKNFINNVSTEYLQNNFNIDQNCLTINGDVIFKHLAHVENLEINGTINGEDLKEIQSKLVRLDDDILLFEDIYFKSNVNLVGNLTVSNITNGVRLDDLYENTIWITRNHTLSSPIRFIKSTEIFNALNVNENLELKFLFNSIFEDTIKNSVFINKGLVKGKYTFEEILINEILTTEFLNAVNLSKVIPLKTTQLITESVNFKALTSVNDIRVNKRVNGKNLEKEINNTKLINKQQNVLSKVVFANNVLVQNLTMQTINNKPSKKIVNLNSEQNLTASYKFVSKIWIEQNINLHGLVSGIDINKWNEASVKSVSKEPQRITKDLEIVNFLTFADSFSSVGLINSINMTNLGTDIVEKRKYKFDVGKSIRDDYVNICTDTTYIYKHVQNQIYKFKYFEKLQKLLFSSLVQYVKYFTFNEKHYLLVNEDNCFSRLMEFKENIFQFSFKIYTGYINQIIVVSDQDNLYLISTHQKGKLKCDIEESTLIWQMDIVNKMKILGAIENQSILQESLNKNTFYGIKNNIVTEFQIRTQTELIAVANKKWKLEASKENMDFMPRGLDTGLCVRTGKELIFLNRDIVEEVIDENVIPDGSSSDTEEYLVANYTVKTNTCVPGKDDGEVVVTNVGVHGGQKSLMVVASHKETEVQHRLDLIEIYTDASSGELFDKILTYKPSGLTSVEFGNGETLLMFLEDNKLLQIYQYKGIEGFQYKSTIRISGSLIFLMELPLQPYLNPRKVLGVVNKNKITLIEAVMSGNRIEENLACDVSKF